MGLYSLTMLSLNLQFTSHNKYSKTNAKTSQGVDSVYDVSETAKDIKSVFLTFHCQVPRATASLGMVSQPNGVTHEESSPCSEQKKGNTR